MLCGVFILHGMAFRIALPNGGLLVKLCCYLPAFKFFFSIWLNDSLLARYFYYFLFQKTYSCSIDQHCYVVASGTAIVIVSVLVETIGSRQSNAK